MLSTILFTILLSVFFSSNIVTAMVLQYTRLQNDQILPNSQHSPVRGYHFKAQGLPDFDGQAPLGKLKPSLTSVAFKVHTIRSKANFDAS